MRNTDDDFINSFFVEYEDTSVNLIQKIFFEIGYDKD
jgi:hypothetical protein